MQAALDAARHKLAQAKCPWWTLVTGPSTALLTTMRRFGWKCEDATTLITDEGRPLDLRVDLPVVVANEVKEAVTRFRWTEPDSVLPGLLPTTADSGLHHPHTRRTVLVPCMPVVSAMWQTLPQKRWTSGRPMVH